MNELSVTERARHIHQSKIIGLEVRISEKQHVLNGINPLHESIYGQISREINALKKKLYLVKYRLHIAEKWECLCHRTEEVRPNHTWIIWNADFDGNDGTELCMNCGMIKSDYEEMRK